MFVCWTYFKINVFQSNMTFVFILANLIFQVFFFSNSEELCLHLTVLIIRGNTCVRANLVYLLFFDVCIVIPCGLGC